MLKYTGSVLELLQKLHSKIQMVKEFQKRSDALLLVIVQ